MYFRGGGFHIDRERKICDGKQLSVTVSADLHYVYSLYIHTYIFME